VSGDLKNSTEKILSKRRGEVKSFIFGKATKKSLQKSFCRDKRDQLKEIKSF